MTKQELENLINEYCKDPNCSPYLYVCYETSVDAERQAFCNDERVMQAFKRACGITPESPYMQVFFEMNKSRYCELVATFEDEELYMACLPALEELRKKRGFDFISESIQ
jgi:hypothetical protein